MTQLQGELDEFLESPVPVDDAVIQACLERNKFGGLSFALCREAAATVWVTCNAYYEEGRGPAISRNQAICIGLLSRISKLMVSVLKLSSGQEHGETVEILNRCILESSVDLQYLLMKDDEAIFQRFVKSGLKSERDLYDIIQENIRNRNGQELGIERDMLLSIARTCENSGVKIEEIDSNAGSWGGSYRDRLNALGLGEGYQILQGTSSQSVHGSWSDLIRNYLDKTDSGYLPKADHKYTDGELFAPMSIFAANAAKAYLDRFFDAMNAQPLVTRLDDLQRRISIVEASRPGWEPTT